MPSEQPQCGRSSVHSVDLYPFAHIKDPIKCDLAVALNGQSTIVAKGRIYQSGDDTLVGNEILLPRHVKVMVDMILDGGEQFCLPVPTKSHDRVGERIIVSFLQWPIELVVVGEDDMSKKEGKKQQLNMHGEQSATGIRPPLVDDGDLDCVGPYGKELHRVLRLVSQSADYFELELDEEVFHHDNSRGIFVQINHIVKLMKMECLSAPIIQIFILYLHRLCNMREVDSIGFLCPTQMAGNKDGIINMDAVAPYICKAMKEMKEKKWILAPYHQVDHWLLLVLSPSSNAVYTLDSIDCDRKIHVKLATNTGFRMYFNNVKGLRSGPTKWITIKCPQQLGCVECGYYVMIYMYEICMKYHELTSLEKAFGDTQSYPKEEVDNIRRLWLEYFVNNHV